MSTTVISGEGFTMLTTPDTDSSHATTTITADLHDKSADDTELVTAQQRWESEGGLIQPRSAPSI